jgi:hypothetical protein
VKRLIALAAAATTVLAVAMPTAARADTPGGCDSKSTTPILVSTVPPVPLFRFSVGNQAFATGTDGTTLVPPSLCGAPVAQETQRTVGDGERLRFQRWFGGPGGGYVATFYADYQVTMRYADRHDHPYPARKIDTITLKNSLGVHNELKPGGTRWLLGSRGVRRANGIHVSRVYWTLEDATIGGLGIVNRNQLKFYPDETRDPLAHLLLFDAKVHTFDAFFGLSLGGTKLKLIYPNNRIELHRFDGGGRLDLQNLPRGQYDMVVIGPGLKMKSPVAITRDQKVDLKVLTYLDLAAVVLFGLLLAGGLFAYGLHRRRRRRRLLAATAAGGALDGDQPLAPQDPPTRVEHAEAHR